jgi:6-phosphogluconolactonase
MNPLLSAARAALLVGLGMVTIPGSAAAVPAGEFHVFFGTYSKGKSKGIYRATFDAGSGKLGAVELAAEASDPSFLAVHPNGRVLYAIDERSDPAKTPGRGVTAYAIGAQGRLTRLNEQEVGGPGPCHVSVDRAGQVLAIANYSGGSVAAIALQPDGRLGAVGSVMKHSGSSVHPTRQKAPHAHAATLAPDDRFVLVPDLGIDRVNVYRLDAGKAQLTAANPPGVALAPGAGPRHVAFRPDGKFVYALNELQCTMTAFRYNAATGALSEVQTISTLPAGENVRPGFSTAEVQAHPNGKWLYGSNRGHDSIVVYAIDGASGKLTPVEHEATQGKTPRHFTLDPTGRWLLAENQGSDSVVVFRVDPANGKLDPTGQTVEVPLPVCAVFVPVK